MSKVVHPLPLTDKDALSGVQEITPFVQVLEQVVQVLDQAVSDPNPPPGLPGDLQACPALSRLYTKLLELRTYLLALVKGELSQELHLKGYLAGALKALQANLRHLTWQTQMIAAGDYSQRVDFMGEFSEAFNSMVIQLHDKQQAIQEKQAALTRLNEDLQAEIELRKQTEALLRQSEASYRQLAITDPLTGISNRRYFFQRAEEELQRACRYQHPLTLIIFDLDFFKQVNDHYGHAAGDGVLRAIADLVVTAIRSVDIFARYGGEEFILLLPETGLEGGVEAAERLRQKIAATPIPNSPRQITVTISAGVAALAAPGQLGTPERSTLDLLIKQADEALYEAKKAGRNQVQAFTGQSEQRNH